MQCHGFKRQYNTAPRHVHKKMKYHCNALNTEVPSCNRRWLLKLQHHHISQPTVDTHPKAAGTSIVSPEKINMGVGSTAHLSAEIESWFFSVSRGLPSILQHSFASCIRAGNIPKIVPGCHPKSPWIIKASPRPSCYRLLWHFLSLTFLVQSSASACKIASCLRFLPCVFSSRSICTTAKHQDHIGNIASMRRGLSPAS